MPALGTVYSLIAIAAGLFLHSDSSNSSRSRSSGTVLGSTFRPQHVLAGLRVAAAVAKMLLKAALLEEVA
jgi:hypothetical protein